MIPSYIPPGYGVQDWQNQGSRFDALRRLGFSPKSILDIGAYHGWWAGLAKHIWPAAEILCIEANEDCRKQLEAKGRLFEIALLDSTEREADYHKCTTGCGEGNGLFKENSTAPFQTVKVKTRTLDQVVGDKTFDFIKLDCQGAELRVLFGGEKTLACAQLVQLETQLQYYNEEAPLAANVIEWMLTRGFRLFDIVDFHYNSRGMLIQTDLLFAKINSPLFNIRPLS